MIEVKINGNVAIITEGEVTPVPSTNNVFVVERYLTKAELTDSAIVQIVDAVGVNRSLCPTLFICNPDEANNYDINGSLVLWFSMSTAYTNANPNSIIYYPTSFFYTDEKNTSIFMMNDPALIDLGSSGGVTVKIYYQIFDWTTMDFVPNE